jgi:hypothetical protein
MPDSTCRFDSLDTRTLPAVLLWVKDAPLFIDDATLDRFYDAVVRPPFSEEVLRPSRSPNARRLIFKQSLEGRQSRTAWLALRSPPSRQRPK